MRLAKSTPERPRDFRRNLISAGTSRAVLPVRPDAPDLIAIFCQEPFGQNGHLADFTGLMFLLSTFGDKILQWIRDGTRRSVGTRARPAWKRWNLGKSLTRRGEDE